VNSWHPQLLEARHVDVRRVWARAGPQHVAYMGRGISCGLAHSLWELRVMEMVMTTGVK